MGGRGASSHLTKGGGGLADYPKLKPAFEALKRELGEKHAEAMLALIMKAPADVRALWEDYGGRFKVNALRAGENSMAAYFSPADDAVHFEIKNGDSWVFHKSYAGPAYTTIFHEFGHMSSSLIARELTQSLVAQDYAGVYKGKDSAGNLILNRKYPILYSSAGALGDSLREELEGHIDRVRQQYYWGDYATSRSYVASRLVLEIKDKYGSDYKKYTGDISDMLEGAGIGFSHPLGLGHGLDYWHRFDVGVEAFAEMTAASISNPKSLQGIKDYFPKSYDVYTEMIKARRKKND